MSDPWGDGTPWKNSVSFFTYLRGCLRKAWSRNPVKLNVLKAKRKQIKNPNPKGNKPTVWGAECEMCHKEFVLKDIQVDHVIAAGSLTKTEDIQGFVERLLYVTEDSLRLVCKWCNSSLAYAEKQGVSFEEARIEKEAILIMKEKRDKEWLIERGVVPESNATKRRKQILSHLNNEKSS